MLAWALDIEVIFENPAGSMIFSFLRQEINSLREIGKVPQFIFMDRCALEPGDKPTFKKRYKFMSSGAWLTKAARSCSCKMPHLKLMNRVEYEDGTVHINGNAHMKGSGLYPAAMGEAIFTAWQRAFRSGSPGSLPVQHVNHVDDDPCRGEAETIDAALAKHPEAKSQQRAGKVAAKPKKAAGKAKKVVALSMSAAFDVNMC